MFKSIGKFYSVLYEGILVLYDGLTTNHNITKKAGRILVII